MVGFYSGDPFDSAAEQAQGSDVIPSTAGQADVAEFTGALAASPTWRLGRAINRGDFVTPEAVPGELSIPASPTLDPSSANAKWGIPGALSFDKPITDAAAQDLHDARHADIVRQDILARAPNTFAQRTVSSIAGSLLDPINLAAGLIPGIGEARVAGVLGEGLAGRLATRAITGATAGAAGMAALEPLNYALDRSEGADWSMGQALRDVAFGGLLGGGLHMALGGLARPAATETAARIEAAGPEARETLLQGSLAQLADGQPVGVAPALDAFEAERWAERTREDPRAAVWQQNLDQANGRLTVAQSELDDLTAGRDARNRGEAPDSMSQYETPQAVDAAVRAKAAYVDALSGQAKVAQHALDTLGTGQDVPFSPSYADPAMNRRVSLDTPKGTPQTMLARLRELGGLQEQGGELAARDLDKTPGMVRASGLPLEGAAVRMAEEGYLPELRADMENNAGTAQVDRIGALLDAVDEERSGTPRVAEQDRPAWDEAMTRHEAALERLRVVAQHLGLTDAEARGLRRGQVEDILRERGSADDAAEAAAEQEGVEPEEAEPAAGAQAPGLDELERQHFRSLDDLMAQLSREDPEFVQGVRDSTEAGAAGPSDLAALEKEVGDLEAGYRPSLDAEGKPVEMAHPEVDAAQAGVDAAEARAKATEQAASCLRRGGA